MLNTIRMTQAGTADGTAVPPARVPVPVRLPRVVTRHQPMCWLRPSRLETAWQRHREDAHRLRSAGLAGRPGTRPQEPHPPRRPESYPPGAKHGTEPMAEIVICVSLLPKDTAGHDDQVTQRRVVFLVYPRFQVLDLAGPHEVFAQTQRWVPEDEGYAVEIVAGRAGAVRACHGIDIAAGSGVQQCEGPLDTLVVVGGPGDREAVDDEELVGWVRAAAGRARRVASVCTGAFLLARAGLLDGRRAVTHWAACERLAHEHPDVTVTPDQIFVHDGAVWTSAGITAGMDLALAMVEEDHGPEVSRAVARMLVMFVQRPGGQAQFSTQLAAQRPTRQPLRDVQAWVTDHLAEDLTVRVLAERAGMSERNFTRVFRAETGLTPAAYVETVRIEAARALLETTDTTIEAIARVCGFGFAETLHRRFKRTLGVTPGQYRHHFSRSG